MPACFVEISTSYKGKKFKFLLLHEILVVTSHHVSRFSTSNDDDQYDNVADNDGEEG